MTSSHRNLLQNPHRFNSIVYHSNKNAGGPPDSTRSLVSNAKMMFKHQTDRYDDSLNLDDNDEVHNMGTEGDDINIGNDESIAFTGSDEDKYIEGPDLVA